MSVSTASFGHAPLPVAAHALRLVVPVVAAGRRPWEPSPAIWTQVATQGKDARLYGAAAWPESADDHSLRESALELWGTNPQLTQVFELHEHSLSGLLGGPLPRTLVLQMAEQDPAEGGYPPLRARLTQAPRLRRFRSRVAHLELDLVLASEAQDTGLLVAWISDLERALRHPKRHALARWEGEAGQTLRGMVDRLEVPVQDERAYTMIGVQLADQPQPPDPAALTEWSLRLARRHPVHYRYPLPTLQALAERNFAGIHEVVAMEGSALLQWNSSGRAAGDWYRRYFVHSWPVSALVPIGLALHERHFLSHLTGDLIAPGQGEKVSAQAVERGRELRNELVRYRVDARLVECSTLGHVQGRFEQARAAFRLDASLAMLDADLEAHCREMALRHEDQRSRRWRWGAGLTAAVGAFLVAQQLQDAWWITDQQRELAWLQAQHEFKPQPPPFMGPPAPGDATAIVAADPAAQQDDSRMSEAAWRQFEHAHRTLQGYGQRQLLLSLVVALFVGIATFCFGAGQSSAGGK